MLLDAAAFGVFLGVALFVLGVAGGTRRPALMVAGALCLIITGALLGADGLNIPAGLNITTSYSYANYTGMDSNYTLIANTTETTTDNYHTIAGIYAGGWALMLIMAGLAGFLAAFNAMSEHREVE